MFKLSVRARDMVFHRLNQAGFWAGNPPCIDDQDFAMECRAAPIGTVIADRAPPDPGHSTLRFRDNLLVQYRYYPQIIDMLNEQGTDNVNASASFQLWSDRRNRFRGYMTSLEFAINRQDLKMIAILIVHGADPTRNKFNGTVCRNPGDFGTHDRYLVDGFDGIHPIKGFDGLLVLFRSRFSRKPIRQKFEAFLRLVQRYVVGDSRQTAFYITRDLQAFLDDVDKVSKELQLSGTICKKIVKQTLLCMNRLGLPNDVAVRVAKEALLSTVWVAINKYALS